MEEGEIVPRKEGKQQKTNRDPRDKRGSSVDNREEAEVRRPQRPWAPRIEMDGAAIPYDASHMMPQYGMRRGVMPTI